MARLSVLILGAMAAAANAINIRCAEASLPGGPGGGEGIPYKMITLNSDSCDYFHNTAGPCAYMPKRSGPLKGKGLCQGAYYWQTKDGCQNVELADGSKHWCCGGNDCQAW